MDKTYDYPALPEQFGLTQQELLSALWTIARVAIVGFYYLGLGVYTLGQRVGYYYYNHDEVDQQVGEFFEDVTEDVKHNARLIALEGQLTALSVTADTLDTLSIILNSDKLNDLSRPLSEKYDSVLGKYLLNEYSTGYKKHRLWDPVLDLVGLLVRARRYTAGWAEQAYLRRSK